MIRILIILALLLGVTVSGNWLANRLGYDVPVVSEALDNVQFQRTSCVLSGGRFSIVEQSWLNVTLRWSASQWLDLEPGGQTFRSSDQPGVLGFPITSLRGMTFDRDAVRVEVAVAEAVGGTHTFRNPEPDCRTTFTAYAGRYPKLLIRSF